MPELYGDSNVFSVLLIGYVVHGIVSVYMGDIAVDLAVIPARSNLDLGMVREALRSDFVRDKFKRADIPTEHAWRELGLDMPEKQ